MSEYAELHCHSEYSLKDGASKVEELVSRASDIGMEALALTDHNAVYGAVSFSLATQKHKIKPIFGAELTLESGHHVTALVKNQIGWENLCSLITNAQANTEKEEASLSFSAFYDHHDGLLLLSGCRQGEVTAALRAGQHRQALEIAQCYRSIFGDNYFIELQHHRLPQDNALNHDLVQLSEALRVPVVATNNVHYAYAHQQRLQDILVSIKHNVTLDEAGSLLRPNAEYHLKSFDQLRPLYQNYPQALLNTLNIAEQCDFSLPTGLQNMPDMHDKIGMPPNQFLRQLCFAGLRLKFPDQPESVCRQLEYELGVIEELKLANYFVVVWDICQFAARAGIRFQVRGSAANSLAIYCMSISPVDPMKYDLVFERFLSRERMNVPDIDIDFPNDRRDEVMEYVYRTYGYTHAARVCTFQTHKSVLRDVSKALGLPRYFVEEIVSLFESDSAESIAESRVIKKIFEQGYDGELWGQIVEIAEGLYGLPRHLGLHSSGMVVFGNAITNWTAVEPARKADCTAIQWDKEQLEDAGIAKIDLLSLGMLSLLARAEQTIRDVYGQDVKLNDLTFDDPEVYRLIAAADTIGLFQVESPAQMQLQPRLQPKEFRDLVAAVALIRPGPVQANMVHPYLQRRLNQEPITYAHPLLEPILKDTYGIILFQENVLLVAEQIAGFTRGEGELLRRALGAKNAYEQIELLRERFVMGAIGQGVPEGIAIEIFEQLKGFGGFSFAKSHAATFAVIVYQSAWLKRYYLAVFYQSLIASLPMGYWSKYVIANDARRHGIKFLGVDLRYSQTTCSLENGAVRLGFEQLKGFSKDISQRLVAIRDKGEFANLKNLCVRSKLPKSLISHLIQVGACDHWEIPRRKLLWKLETIHFSDNPMELEIDEESVALPALSDLEALGMEFALTEMVLGDHPLTSHREWLNRHKILDSKQVIQCDDGTKARVAGMLVDRRSPETAKGMVFLVLEDEAGLIHAVCQPHTYERYRKILHKNLFFILSGKVQKANSVVSFLVDGIGELST